MYPRRSSKPSRAYRRKGNALLQTEIRQANELGAIRNNTQGMARQITSSIPDPLPMVLSRGKVYTFEREWVYATVTASTSVDQAGVVYFTLSSLPGATEFTSLFDVYRVEQLIVTFVSLTTGPYISPLTTIIDYDDANAVSSLNELLEYQTQQTSSPGANHQRVFKPRASAAVYSGAFTSFATTAPRTWFDCASSTVQFYGLKWYLPALTGGTSTQVYSIRAKAMVQFKDVR